MRAASSEPARIARLCLPVLALLCSCTTLSVEEERQLGREWAREARSEFLFMRDAVVLDYVRDIAAEILDAAGPQPFDYQFFLVEDDAINAFAAPAGYIYLHTETVLQARNVSELAGVMAHEVGHVVRRHIAENHMRQRWTGIGHQAGVMATSVLAGSTAAGAANLLGGLAGMAYLNTFGREAEREADAFAVDVLPRAGYDPRGLVSFFETLRREGGPEPPAFLSSHPATAERIANTSGMIEALPRREGLRIRDDGKLEIIQRRIRLLTGVEGGGGR